MGKLKDVGKPLEDMSERELTRHNLLTDRHARLEFESGVTVEGVLEQITRRYGRNPLFRFSSCQVFWKDSVPFKPSMGYYDMAVGISVISAFPGPADPEAFGFSFPVPEEKTYKIDHTPEKRALHGFYLRVREIREGKRPRKELDRILNVVLRDYPVEWLLMTELMERPAR